MNKPFHLHYVVNAIVSLPTQVALESLDLACVFLMLRDFCNTVCILSVMFFANLVTYEIIVILPTEVPSMTAMQKLYPIAASLCVPHKTVGLSRLYMVKIIFYPSRTAQPVPVVTDPIFELAVVESTPSSLEL